MNADGTVEPVSGRRIAVVTLLVVALAGGATLVAAHGNHVSANPQVADDGLVVESASVAGDGHLVVHRDDDGRPGEPIGHAGVEQGYHENVRVTLDADVGAETTLWVVLHEDDGDGEFDPADDPPLESFGSVAGRQVSVRPGDRPVYVSAPGQSAQRVDDGTVRVDRVAAAEDGRVEIRAVDGGQPGDVVGSTAVSAGVNENVTVDVDESFVAEQPEHFGVYVVLATAEGDVVDVGGEPVHSRLSLRTGDGGSDDGGDGDVDVVTATTDEAGGDGADDDGDDESGVLALPGFGVVAALVAVVALLAAARLRED
ncbi:hypothetical protein BRD18_02390 [Halobacteriales archaeon SW_7_71_33]|nr:MAG: hypothetical protein BRD18_02390 [Halobacteriales archaeon SW_7_71_33]